MKPKVLAEQGQALILIALAAIGLVAVVALGVDGSAKYSDRRHAQNAADTAALAAALEKTNLLSSGQTDSICSTSPMSSSTYCLDIINIAWDRAEENGYDGLEASDVEVYSPPISGPYIGKLPYIQVIINSRVNTFFARIIGITQTKNTVQAVALAGKGGSIAYGASVIAMNPNPNCSGGLGSGGGSFDVIGDSAINLSGGGIFVNSSASCGFSCGGTPILNMTGGAGGISSAGSDIDQSCGISVSENQSQTQILVPDEVVYPDKPAECGTAPATPTDLGGDRWRIYPGYYTDFPQGGLIAANKDIELASGVYCIDADVHWSGATFDLLDGTSGVTIYITAGHDFSININSPILLDASNSGDYAGYLIIVEGNLNTHPNCIINGGSYLDMNGTIFAPYCAIRINGDNATESEFNAQIIGWTVTLNGTNTININYDPDTNAKIKRRVGLMR